MVQLLHQLRAIVAFALLVALLGRQAWLAGAAWLGATEVLLGHWRSYACTRVSDGRDVGAPLAWRGGAAECVLVQRKIRKFDRRVNSQKEC